MLAYQHRTLPTPEPTTPCILLPVHISTPTTITGNVPVKVTAYLIKSTIVGALGGLLFGFDTAVIAGTTQQLTDIFHLTPYTLGLTVFIGLAGTVLGAMFSGILGQRIGGREALRIMAILYTVSAVGCALAWNWPALMIFRFIGGVGIGGSSVLGPVYIAELAPARWRGRMVGLFQINIVIGILLAYLLQLPLEPPQPRPKPLALAARCRRNPVHRLSSSSSTASPAPPAGSSPQNRTDEALDVLNMMGAPDSKAELEEIMASIHMERGAAAEPLFKAKYRLPIFLRRLHRPLQPALRHQRHPLLLQTYIFAAAGFSQLSGSKQTVLIGLMNLLATLLGMSLIDKLGRKTLLLIGAVGTALCLSGVAAIFFSQSHQSALVWLLAGYIAFFAISQGAVIWVYISEVFPTRVRAKGQSLGSSSHWIMNAIISLIFPIMAKSSGGAPFAFFAAMMALQFFVVLFFYPETKGITLEQLQHKLGIA